MNEQDTIDGLGFARQARTIHGTMPLASLGRVADRLLATDGTLAFSLAGGKDERGNPVLDLKVSGTLQLTCQRCLERMDFMLDSTTRFVVVRDEASLPAVEDDAERHDYLVAGESQSVLDLVEEDVLLNLPMAPKHDRADCAAPLARESGNKALPFDVLGALKPPHR